MRFSACIIIGAAAIALATSSTGAAPEEESWDLNRCVREALAVSRSIGAADARVDAARAVAGRAGADRLPAVAFRGGYRYASEVMSIDLPSAPLFPGGEIQFGDGNTYELAVGLEAPLFTGGALARRARAERAGVRASEASLQAENAEVMYAARRAYFSVLGAEAGKSAARLALDRVQRHHRDLLAAIEVGAATREAAVQVLSHVRKAEESLIEADEAFRVARLALGEVVGRPGEEIAVNGDLHEPLWPESDGPPQDVGVHPALASLDQQRERSLQMASAAKGSLFPSLYAEAFYHYDKPGIDLIENEWMDYATVGLLLRWTLWDWGARSHDVERAEAAARELAARRAEMDDRLQTGLAVASAKLGAARARKEKAEERVRLEEERYRMVESRYHEAQATESELLDAHDDRAGAEVALVATTTQIRLAEADLLRILAR